MAEKPRGQRRPNGPSLRPWRRLFRRPSFWVLLLTVGMVLFVWPVVSLSEWLARAFVRRRKLFVRPAFWNAVFFLGCLMFSWPFMTGVEHWTGFELYRFLFGAWSVVILLVGLIGASLPKRDDDSRNGPSEF